MVPTLSVIQVFLVLQIVSCTRFRHAPWGVWYGVWICSAGCLVCVPGTRFRYVQQSCISCKFFFMFRSSIMFDTDNIKYIELVLPRTSAALDLLCLCTGKAVVVFWQDITQSKRRFHSYVVSTAACSYMAGP